MADDLDIRKDFPMEEILSFVEYHGNQTKAAKALGISNVYLSDIVLGNREVSQRIAHKFGWERCWKRKALKK